MEQLKLPMLTVYDGPRLVDLSIVDACTDYREAVRICWSLRTRRNLTQRLLAEEAGLYAPHVSDYLSTKRNKRSLPAEAIAAVEVACGNRFITQWHTRRAGLTILEQFIARRAA